MKQAASVRLECRATRILEASACPMSLVMARNRARRLRKLERAKRRALAGDYRDALTILDDLLAARSSDADALVLRGNVLDLMGEGLLARTAYETVLRHHPGHIRALIDLAELDEDAERPEAALLQLDLAQTLLENGQAYLDQAQELEEVFWAKYRCYRAMGRSAEARGILEQGVKLCPDSSLLRGLLAKS